MTASPAAPATPGQSPHPRPHLARREWRDLSGTWQFAYDDSDRGLGDDWPEHVDVFDRSIVVPYPPEAPASGIGDESYHPVLWYRRTFRAAPVPGRRLLLHFGAVDYAAQVWVNGRLVMTHEGGHTPFAADITPALNGDGEQVLVVRAHDDPHDLTQPRGKQDWQEEAHAIWYSRTSGIWQPVWLEEVAEAHIAGLRWTADADRAALHLAVDVHGRGGRELRLHVRIRLADTVLVEDVASVLDDQVRREFTIPNTDIALGRSEFLWSPETPNLLDVDLQLTDTEGTTVDEVTSYTALRSVGTSGDRLLLNGRPYFLRLVLEQGFWPQTHLAAPDDDALRREVELIKDLGFNGVRLHQKVEDPRFLAWCDRLGLLVWAEMPAAYEFSPASVARLTREWIEVLERDASHPCVIAWVPVNESWGVPALARDPQQQALVRSLFHLTKALDSTRLVVGNDGWEQLETDLVTVHDYASRGAVLRERYGDPDRLATTLRQTQPGYRNVLLDREHRGEPVVVSEFGGIALDLDAAGASWRGYGGVRDSAELLAHCRELVDPLLDSAALAGFCWTQLTDVQQERNGLLTEDRRPKVEPAAIRAVIARHAAAVPGDAINEFAYGEYVPNI